MDINWMLTLFSGALLVFACFSTVLQRASLPGPLLCLVFGVLIGPHALGLLKVKGFEVPELAQILGRRRALHHQ